MNHSRLQQDHVPVIDEDKLQVDYIDIIQRAINVGYQSVMLDGSRLPLEKNIECTRKVVEIAHDAGIPVEAELGADWLSVAIGNVHGAISNSQKHKKKVEAQLDINRLKEIFCAVSIPLVLHGGTGIKKHNIRKAIKEGIAKINVGTAIRQPYENKIQQSLKAAQEAVYQTTRMIICDELEIENSASLLK